MPRLTATQSHSNQSVCVTDTDLPSINELIPYVQVQSDIRVWCPRRPPRRLAYRTFFICKLGDRFVQLMLGGFTPQSKKTSFWVVVVSLLSLLPIS